MTNYQISKPDCLNTNCPAIFLIAGRSRFMPFPMKELNEYNTVPERVWSRFTDTSLFRPLVSPVYNVTVKRLHLVWRKKLQSMICESYIQARRVFSLLLFVPFYDLHQTSQLVRCDILQIPNVKLWNWHINWGLKGASRSTWIWRSKTQQVMLARTGWQNMISKHQFQISDVIKYCSL